MFQSGPGSLIFAFLIAAAATFGAGAATTEYPVGVAPCEGEVPLCNPAQHFQVTTDGTLSAEVRADADNCYPIVVRLFVDDIEKFESGSVAAGASTGVAALGPLTAGTHKLSVEAEVASSGSCDVRGWFGTLAVTTSGVAASDVGTAMTGGDIVTVSTAVLGSPRPAGITATLTRSATAIGTAQISVATYDGLPSGLPPNPIRAAAFLDLQLTNADAGDTIAGEFLPPNPILPPNPVFPTDPLFPTDPTLPPNPIRLAWWSGSDWSPVLIPTDPLIPPVYDSVLGRLTFDFTAASSPSVFQLSGTVFAVIPNYYFRGFGTPVDRGTLNVAKPGRAIPLKWQVFDEVVAPVTDLDPEVVKVSSVVINCAASGSGTDVIEEYATGQSGLQNLGDGVYQLNWSTSKSYAGTCRRLRLDLGERNPDGSVFYRTADFQFTR
jgi:hypothetical protein